MQSFKFQLQQLSLTKLRVEKRDEPPKKRKKLPLRTAFFPDGKRKSETEAYTSLRVEIESPELLTIEIEYRGLLVAEEPSDGLLPFAKGRGPLLLYPYIRADVLALSHKLDVPPIILPILDVVRSAPGGDDAIDNTRPEKDTQGAPES